MGVGSQRHASAALPPGKTRYPLYRRLGGPQGWSGRVRKICPPPAFDPQTVQPVASRYTDWAIAAHEMRMSGDWHVAQRLVQNITHGVRGLRIGLPCLGRCLVFGSERNWQVRSKLNAKTNFTLVQVMKDCRGEALQLYSFFNCSTLKWME